MTPDENFAFINSYLERMGPVIRDHNGFIDKYIGDAIMALFENADDALRAGLAMFETLERFNDDRRPSGLGPVAIGIGTQQRVAHAGHHRREAPHGRHRHLRCGQPRLAGREPDQGLSRRHPDLADTPTTISPIRKPTTSGRSISWWSRARRSPSRFSRCSTANDPAERAAKARTRDHLLSGVEALIRLRYSDRPPATSRTCLALLPGDPAATNLLKSCALVSAEARGPRGTRPGGVPSRPTAPDARSGSSASSVSRPTSRSSGWSWSTRGSR